MDDGDGYGMARLRDDLAAVRETEEQYRTLAEASLDAIFIIGRDDRVRYVNPTAAGMCGCRPGDLIGRRRAELFPPDVAEQQGRNLRRVFETGEPLSVDERTVFGDRVAWLETKLVPICGADGAVRSVVGFSRDVTERKEAERALREARDGLEAAVAARTAELERANADLRAARDRLGALGSIINRSQAIAFRWRVAEGWPVEFVSDNVDQLGYTPEGFLSGRVSWPAITHPEDHSRIKREVKAYLRDGVDEFRQEYRLRTASGEWRWVEERNLVLRDAAGAVTHIQGVVLDVTARKRAEEALREAHAELEQRVAERTAALSASEERYRSLLGSIPDGVYRCDRAGRFTFVNDVIVERSGRPREWFLSHGFVDLVPPEQRPAAEAALEATLRGERVRAFEASYPTPSGETVHVEANAAPLYDGGAIVGVAGVSRDITARKQAEAALRFRLEFERLIVTVSSSLISVPGDQLDGAIADALGQVAAFTGADRSYVFQITDEGRQWSNTHEWCGEGIEPAMDELQGLPLTAFPWCFGLMLRGEAMHVPRVADLPSEAGLERAEFEREGIQSIICMPMACQGQIIGFVGFDAVRVERRWTDDEIALLRIAGEAFANALVRRRADEALRHRVALEEAVSAISTRFLALPPDAADAGIDFALATIGALAEADRCYLFHFAEDGRVVRNTHEWCAEGIDPQIADLQQVAVADTAWICEPLLQGEATHIPCVADMPATAADARGHLEAQGIQSLVAVPLQSGHQVIGFLGFDAVRTEKRWAEADITLLRTVGNVIAEALERQRAEGNYRAIFEAANDAIFVHDAETGEIVDANAQAKETFGYGPAELVGRSAGALSVGRPPYTEADALRRVRRAAGGSPQLFEWLARDRWGRELWVEVSLKRATLGGRERVLAIVRDASARKRAEAETRDSEERFRQMADNVREVFWLYDRREHRMLYVSPAFEAIWGRPAALLYEHFEDAVKTIHPDDRAQAEAEYVRMLDTGEDTVREYRIVRPDGEVRWIADRTFAVRDADGEIYRIGGIAEDITERKAAEEALRHSEELWRSLAENAPAFIGTLDRHGTILFLNRAMPGHTPEEAIGTRVFDYVPRRHHRRIRAALGRVFADGTSQEHELAARGPGGAERWFSARVGPIWGDGEVEQAIVIATDITQRRRAQEALRASEERYRALVHASPDAIMVLAPDGRIVEVSQRVLELNGLASADDLVGQSAFERVVPGDQAKAAEAFAACLAEGEARGVELTLSRADGSTYVAEVNAAVMRDAKGRPEAVVTTTRDITERKRAEEALRASEARHRAVVSDQTEMITRYLPGTTELTFVNEACWRTFASSADEMIGRPMLDYVAEEHRPFVLEGLARLTCEHPTETVEHPVVERSGEVRWEQWTNRAIFDDGGTVVEYQGVGRDVTERRRTEEQLRLLFSAVAQSSEGIAMADLAGHLLFVNPASAAMHGWTAEELVGRHLSVFHAPDQMPAVDAANRQILDAGGFSGEIWHARRDGTPFPALMHNTLLRDDAGEPVGMIGTMRDITERKRAEDALRESEEKFRTLAEQIGDGVVLMIGGRVAWVSQAFCQAFGYAESDLIGQGIERLVVPEDVARARQRMLQRLAGGDIPPYFHTTALRRDGSRVQVEVAAKLVTFQGGPAVLAVVRDITERLRREEELVRAQKLEALGVLAGGIAHDFNNILTGIIGNLSYVRQAVEPTSDAAESLADAERAGLRAKRITGQLLALSKGGAPVRTVALLGDIVRETAEFALSGSDVRLELGVPAGLWPVEADVGQISQVVQNLVINADQAMPEGGTIEVRARNVAVDAPDAPEGSAAGWVEIAVADQGVGIAPEHLERIFDPYFTTKQAGSGLGLTVCHTIVAHHGGHIRVESEGRHGATFRVFLPAAEAEPAPAEPAPEAGTGPTGRILLMDDDDIVRRAGSWLLRRLGHHVEAVADGDAALERYRAALDAGQPFDAVILDLTVRGGMGGQECIRRLRELDPGVVAIVCSGYSNEPIMAHHQDHGFQGVILKPYDIDDLDAELRRLLAHRPR